MTQIYLTPKQLIFLILPFVIALYIFIYPQDFISINNKIDNVITKQTLSNKDIEKANKKLIFKDTTFIKNKLKFYETSLLQFNNETSTWIIDKLKKDFKVQKKYVHVNNTILKIVPIDVTKYNLQMIFNSKDSSSVVINNKIYKLYDKIDKDIKIINILEDRVLLENKKGKRWLYLIK